MPRTIPAAGEAMPKIPETIASLFTQWAANPDSQPGADYAGLTQAQMDTIFAEYSDLQRRIIEATPTTAKEVAQQYFVATDGGASEIPEELFERLRQLAWEGIGSAVDVQTQREDA